MRGAASGMRATFQNAGQVLSIGVFFPLMVVGLAKSLPTALSSGLTEQGVPVPTANAIAQLPPVGTLFAAFLGYNPIGELLGPQVLGALPQTNQDTLKGLKFFPQLISIPFHDGLVIVFWLAIAMAVIGALASLLRSRPVSRSAAGTSQRSAASDSQERIGEFVAHEAELIAEFVPAQPFAPATAIAEPLNPTDDDDPVRTV